MSEHSVTDICWVFVKGNKRVLVLVLGCVVLVHFRGRELLGDSVAVAECPNIVVWLEPLRHGKCSELSLGKLNVSFPVGLLMDLFFALLRLCVVVFVLVVAEDVVGVLGVVKSVGGTFGLRLDKDFGRNPG